ncbi:Diadenosine 5',5'''-P1,P4-tetraphosphate phosphorylase 2 [Yarrowia sp. B02]|nr:Diadenosine 5',5'''-P1,P4-tetraphosphate phosphorylase 2 [Yarrowia sp. B02]
MFRRPSLPANFPELLTKTFESAVKSGDLIYTESTQESATDNGVDVRYTFAPALAKKPTKEDNAADEKTEKPKFNPFEKPDPKLMLVPDFGDYSLVLNKYAIVPNHFMCISKKVIPQTAPLTPNDLEHSYAALQAAQSDGTKYIGFFNCGPNSGASVDHKHIQFIQLPKGFKPFPESVIKAKGRDYKPGQQPLSSERVPYAHYIVPWEAEWAEEDAEADNDAEVPIEDPVAEELGFKFSTVLSRVLTELRVNDAPSISYNVVFTDKWLMAVPRSKESYKGISINATGTVGLLLAKSQEQLDLYKEETPLKVLTELGYVKPIEEEHPEYDY